MDEKEHMRDFNDALSLPHHYQITAEDADQLIKMRNDLLDFCKERHLPMILLVQTANMAQTFALCCTNHMEPVRTAGEVMLAQYIMHLVESKDPKERFELKAVSEAIKKAATPFAMAGLLDMFSDLMAKEANGDHDASEVKRKINELMKRIHESENKKKHKPDSEDDF